MLGLKHPNAQAQHRCLDHVLRHVFKNRPMHLCDNVILHMPKHMVDMQVLARYVNEHMLSRHMLGHLMRCSYVIRRACANRK